MGPKHILLVLPALLAAMGGAAHAGERTTVPPELISASSSNHIEFAAETPAGAEESLVLEAEVSASGQEAAVEIPSRTIFDILAEARGRIGYLPTPAAAPALMSALIAEDRPALADAAPPESEMESDNASQATRLTIFDILAEAQGDRRFLTKADSLDHIAEELPGDRPAEAGEALEVQENIAGAPETLAPEPPTSSAFAIIAGEQGDSGFPLQNEVLSGSVAEDPSDGASAAIVRPTESEFDLGEPAQSLLGEAPRQGDTLSEAKGSARFQAKEVLRADEATHLSSGESSAEAGRLPETRVEVGDGPHGVAADAPRRGIFDILAEAQGNPRFLAKDLLRPVSDGQQQSLGEIQETSPAAPRRGIFDILAEAQGSPRFQPTDVFRSVSGERELSDSPRVEAGQPLETTTHPGNAIEATAPRPLPPSALGEVPPTRAATPTAQGEPADKAPDSMPAAPPGPAKRRLALLAAAEIDPAKLDELRGGFETPGGLRVSFGIERAVIVNGVLQSSTQLQVNDLARKVGGGSNPADTLPAPGTVAVVQNGVNNALYTTLPAAALTTVVQNSLDNQQIQTITRINATVNSGEMMRGARMQQSIQDSLNRAALAR